MTISTDQIISNGLSKTFQILLIGPTLSNLLLKPCSGQAPKILDCRFGDFFVKLQSFYEPIKSHAEVCEQMRMKTTDAESREYLASIIKLKNSFLKSFGTLTARDVNMVSLERLRAFLINVAMKDPGLFGELMLIIGTTRPEFCGNIIEMNHYMKLNDELFDIGKSYTAEN